MLSIFYRFEKLIVESNHYLIQNSLPVASAASNLPGNRKDANRLPKSSIRKSVASAASCVTAAGVSAQSGASANDSAFSVRPRDMYDSDEDELKDDPLYAPPRKFMDRLEIYYYFYEMFMCNR